MRKLLFTLSLLFGFLSNGLTQDCCDVDTKLVICYTAQADHCLPAVCTYTYDGDFMEGLRLKLNNPANFGPNGIAQCEVEPKELGLVSTVQEINNLQCDIILVGSFYIDLNTITSTTLDPSLLNAVIEWSKECDENLVIASQGETSAWGYGLLNMMDNPNTAGSVTEPNIFNGVFGSLTNFNQGGAFQANFNQIPPTGATILAESNSGLPTIVLDNATNDILLADVGMICNGPGDVTVNPNIVSDNDILACNLFALGCEIAGMESFTEIDAFICEDESYTLPDGIIVDQEGEYQSNLLSSNDCDSIIVTTVMFSIPQPSNFEYVGCDQDGFEVIIGNNTYNQDNPSGVEIVPNIYGCDSTVNIALTFNEHTNGVFDTTICIQDQFDYLDVNFNRTIDTTLVRTNVNGCDSFINVLVSEFDFPNIAIDSVLEITNNIPYTFNNTIPLGYNISWSPESGLSCTDCPNPVLNNSENIPTYTLSIESDGGCISNFDVNVGYICTPYIPNIFNPESDFGNDRFGAFTPCELQDFSISVFDRWGTLVFSSEDQSILWDGRLNKNFVVPGVYVYLCEYSNFGLPEQEVGQLTITR